ncbi:GH3 family domain-containing protein [Kribbella sindirgiensis]|nr:GH3 auxin-responsive promoter family protein [Kribbella sindirgiensis]
MQLPAFSHQAEPVRQVPVSEKQSIVLAEMLAANRESAFGHAHELGKVRTIDDYRKAVPIRYQEEFAPWVQRMADGESRVLSCEPPIAFLASSGTLGVPKRTPVTRTYLERCYLPFYLEASARLIGLQPEALGRSDSALNLWQDWRGHGEGAYVGPSQLDYRRLGVGAAGGSQAPWTYLPAEFDHSGPWDRAYLRLRIAVEHNLHFVIAINPAIAAALPYQLDLWWPRLVEDLARGTVGGIPFGPPNPQRARQIESVAQRTGKLRPSDIWPELKAVLTWNSYIAELYLPSVLAEYGATVRAVPAPIGSSEGLIALPTDPDRTDGPLAASTCLYEFVPADGEISPDSPTRLAHELEAGQDYHVVLSHLGGLYRCATRDIVSVTDHQEDTPWLSFAGRDSGAPAPGGAKVSEPQILRAMKGAVAATGMQIRNFTWAPQSDAHRLAIAFDRAPAPADVTQFSRILDKELASQSPAYRGARAANRVGAATTLAVPNANFLAHWSGRVQDGERPPLVKDRVFQRDIGIWTELTSEPLSGGGD